MLKIEQHLVYKLFRPSNIFWLGVFLAQFSFLTTIGLPYQGEEAVYTITSLEMVFNQQWTIPTLYGKNYARPPLLNWLIIPISAVLGWEQILVASRLATALVTFLTTLLLIWFTEKLFKNRSLALLSGLIYMSGDVLFRRGWLAYADPLFSFFVFGAIASLWIAVLEKRLSLICISLSSLIASFLTKALTGYCFYLVTALVLCWRYSERIFLLKPISLVLHALAFLFPVIWNLEISEGVHGASMIQDIIARWDLKNISQYFFKISFYPLNTFLHWLPVSGVVLYCCMQKIIKKEPILLRRSSEAITALWIFGLNYIPYWLAPETYTRYLMPLYPLIALLISYLVWQWGEAKIKVVFMWVMVAIVMRYMLGIWGLPYYEKNYRGDYENVAQDILTLTQDAPVYVTDHSATGLSVTACLNVLRMPHLLTAPPAVWTEGFLLASTPRALDTEVKRIYQLGNHPLYLLCRGNACRLSR